MYKDFKQLAPNLIDSLDKGTNAAFLGHIHKFMQQMKLYPSSGTAWVALSGGMDSMALAVIMLLLKRRGYLKEVKLIHINHKLRSGNDDEESFLKALFKSFDELLTVKTIIREEKLTTNIEHEAREGRYTLLESEVSEGDCIYLAHHLNDSFEWSLLQKMRSSEIVTCLGIPVKRGVFRRPLLCVSREQIESFVRANDLPYVFDPTNNNNRFERNYLRNEVIPKLAKRYPQYLKHYATRSNKLARRLGVYAGKKINLPEVIESAGSALFIDKSLSNNFEGAQELILAQIYRLSAHDRGTYSKQVDKIIQAVKNDKQGPLSLSGRLKCFMSSNLIFIIREDEIKKLSDIRPSFGEFKKYSFHEFYQEFRQSLSENSWQQFPFYVSLENPPKRLKKLKTHCISNETQHWLIKTQKAAWPALELLRIWKSDSYLNKKSLFLSLS